MKTRQESIIKEFKPEQNTKISLSRQQSQNDRERAAFSVLMDTARCERSPLEVLNIYAAKTKAVIKVEFDSTPDKIFVCESLYSSLNRIVDGQGEATTKKQAQHRSALSVLNKLRELDGPKMKGQEKCSRQ